MQTKLFVRRLIGQVAQVLLHQRPILLWIFFGLRLLERSTVAARQAREGTAAGHCVSCTITAVSIPISFVAVSLRVGLALPFPGRVRLRFSTPIAFRLALAAVLAFAFGLALAFALPCHRSFGANSSLRQSQRALSLSQGLSGGCRALLRRRILVRGRLRAALRG